jgi:predicted O-methyltransferase YrrM
MIVFSNQSGSKQTRRRHVPKRARLRRQEAAGAKNVVELGTSTGLSGLWISLSLAKTGGKLTTFAYDSSRAAIARRHFKKAGVDQIVNIITAVHNSLSSLKRC